jgi:hypothetical protein
MKRILPNPFDSDIEAARFMHSDLPEQHDASALWAELVMVQHYLAALIVSGHDRLLHAHGEARITQVDWLKSREQALRRRQSELAGRAA